MGKSWIDCLEEDCRRLQEKVTEQDEEIERLTKISSDLIEANHKKKNRIEHQKRHIKHLEETVRSVKAINEALATELRIAKGDLTKEEQHAQDFIDGTFDRRQDNA